MSPPAFSAAILSAGQGGHAVVVPKEVAAAFSVKRPAVLARVDGVEYRSRLAVYGGQSYLGLRKELLRQIGRQAGDMVEITLEEDDVPTPAPTPAEVTEPPELLTALAENPAAQAAYQALPPSHRQEYAKWIGEAKRADTRAERVDKMVRRLSGD